MFEVTTFVGTDLINFHY